MAGNAYALDGSVSAEFKSYNQTGSQYVEGIANVGKQFNKIRPFAEIKYNADNQASVQLDHRTTEYKLGLGTTFIKNINLEGGVAFVQNLRDNTPDDRGIFVKATYTFETK